MDERVREFLSSLADLPDFFEADLSDINASATDGDNALHVAVHRDDLSTARALIEAGIDVNKPGDLGYTPLHAACIRGNLEIVSLLVEKGADLFALSEGVPPFTSARLAKHDRVCDFLSPLMRQIQAQDPKIWIRARIAQLRREIAYLEAKLES